MGPKSDPAGVLSGGGENDAVKALQLIAALGATHSNATFVSRADASGTSVQEQILWGLVRQQVTPTPPMVKACNAPAADTTRYTWIKNQSTMTNLQIVSHDNAPTAVGSAALQANLLHAYALQDSGIYPNGYHPNEAAALRFLNYLQSPTFQSLDTAYSGGGPMTGDAFRVVNQDDDPPTCTRSGGLITLRAEMDYAPPPTPPITGGLPVTLQKSTNGGGVWTSLATNNANSTTGVVTFAGIASSSPGPSPSVRFRLLTSGPYDDPDAFSFARFAPVTPVNPINDAWDPNPC